MLRRSFLVAMAGFARGATVRASRVSPKAVYLSSFGLGARRVREPVFRLLEDTELNALVIDVKGDRGWIAYPSCVALAQQIGAQRIIPAKDADATLRLLKSRGVYLIARIVVFQGQSTGAGETIAGCENRKRRYLSRPRTASLDGSFSIRRLELQPGYCRRGRSQRLP